jgi:hypothetical protein
MYFIVIPPFVSLLFLGIKKNLFKFFFVSVASFLPLLLFFLIRLIITGQIGLVSFSGASMSGNGLYFLDKKNIKLISQENKNLASKILDRKLKLSFPCNLSIDEAKELQLTRKNYYANCWNIWHMTSWLETIKNESSIEPFMSNDSRNLEPWLYMNLGNFFTKIKDNNLYDQKLSNLSMEIFKLNKLKVFKKIIISPIDFIKIMYPHIKRLIYLNLIIMIIYLVFNKILNKNKQTLVFNLEAKLVISVLFFQLLNFLILFGLHSGEVRSLSVNSFLFIPIIFGYLLYISSNQQKN